MFECSLYGMVKEKFEWNSKDLNRTEKIYTNGQKKAIVTIQESFLGPEHIVTFYDFPDKNKQRTSLVSRIIKIKTDTNYNEFLLSQGYSYLLTNHEKGNIYRRNGYMLEISKLIRKSNILDSSEEDNTPSDGIPELLFNSYLVKAYVITEDYVAGEEILQAVSADLIDVVKLIKPSLNCF